MGAMGADEGSTSCEGGVFLFLEVRRNTPFSVCFWSGCQRAARVMGSWKPFVAGQLVDVLYCCRRFGHARARCFLVAVYLAHRQRMFGSEKRSHYSKSQQFTTAHNSESKIAVTVVPSHRAIQGPPSSQFIFTAGSQRAVTCCELLSDPINLWRRATHRGRRCTCHVSQKPLNLESGAVRGPRSCGRFTAPRHPPARPPRPS